MKERQTFKYMSTIPWGIDFEYDKYPGHERIALGLLQRLVEAIESHALLPPLLTISKDGHSLNVAFFNEEWPETIYQRNIGHKVACVLGKWETADLREALAVLDVIDFPKLTACRYEKTPYSERRKNLRKYWELVRIYRKGKKGKGMGFA